MPADRFDQDVRYRAVLEAMLDTGADPSLRALVDQLKAYVQHKPGCRSLHCWRCGVSLGGNHIVYWEAVANSHAQEPGDCTCGLTALLAGSEQPQTKIYCDCGKAEYWCTQKCQMPAEQPKAEKS